MCRGGGDKYRGMNKGKSNQETDKLKHREWNRVIDKRQMEQEGKRNRQTEKLQKGIYKKGIQ